MPFSNQIERINNQAAFILHRRPFRNTSLILDIFCKDYGRLSLVAKGAMSQKSRLKGILQAFQPLTISWVRKGEMGTLVSAESISPPYSLLDESLYSALYINEILLRLVVKDDPHPNLFATYNLTLNKIQTYENIEPSLRQFEKELLQTIGYEIDLLHEAETHDLIKKESRYRFLPEHGFIKIENSEETGFIFTGELIINFANNKMQDKLTLKAARIITQQCLKRLLGESELKSRELYKAFVKTKI